MRMRASFLRGNWMYTDFNLNTLLFSFFLLSTRVALASACHYHGSVSLTEQQNAIYSVGENFFESALYMFLSLCNTLTCFTIFTHFGLSLPGNDGVTASVHVLQ